MTHTPGPWKWVEGPWLDALLAPEGYQLGADYVLNPESFGAKDDDVMQADARLIASAPELLEALKGLLAGYVCLLEYETDTETINTDPLVIAARSAIAQAT